MLWAVILLGVISLALIGYIILMKREIRMIRREVERTTDKDYNRLLLIQLMDSDINELAAALNKTIEYQKNLKSEAELAEKTLRHSVSDIAHDLRTPLAVIKGDLQLVMRDNAVSAKSRDYVEMCLDKTEQLREMTEEFFELAVLESDRAEVVRSRVNLTNLLMQFIAENEGLIRMAGLEPDISLPPSTVFVMADEALVRRMLGNLLGNVLKYSRDSFALALGTDGSVTISNPIADSDVDTKRLFERSYRGDSARSGSGAGLGLYIVKLLAEKQGAEAAAFAENGKLAVKICFKAVK